MDDPQELDGVTPLTALPEALKAHLREALRLQASGQLKAAESLCQWVRAQHPSQPDTLHLLGILQHQSGASEAAVATLARATTLRPQWAEAHNNLGNAWFALGRLDEAAAAYHRAYALQPALVEALNSLGNVYRLQGDVAAAERAYRECVRVKPQLASAHNDLGTLLRAAKRYQAARVVLETAAALAPDSAVVLNNLAQTLVNLGDSAQALQVFARALALAPAVPELHYGQGNAHWLRGDFASALRSYARAVALRPDFIEALNNLGNACSELGRLDQAVRHYQAATRIQPGYAEGWNNLGNAFAALNRTAEAKRAYARAIELRPDYAKAMSNLGKLLMFDGQLAAAEAWVRRSLELKPANPATLSNLGYIRLEQGCRHAGYEALRQALALKPDWAKIHSSLLFRLCYDPDISAEALFAEHRAWGERYTRNLAGIAHRLDLTRAAERPLRVGYVSADLARHPIGYFMLGVMRAHDHDQISPYVYSGRVNEDAVTDAIREHCTQWRRTVKLGDQALADLIVADEIDILVDLSGHTGGNRLNAFALRPAPVQVTWLGYCDTTGCDAIDYVIMDATTVPPEGRKYFSETVVYLPQTRLTYTAPETTPEVAALPARTRGQITFGSFNNLLKVNERVLALWARVLAAVPGSRLLINWKSLRDAERRAGILDAFAAVGIAPERIELRGGHNDPAAVFADYHEVDIGLDTLPYSGGVTTCEALWMGVPVVSMLGARAVARQSAALLTAVGLTDWVARDEEAYVAIATAWANDLNRLADLRRGLRERVKASPLQDSAALTAQLERLYQALWQRRFERFERIERIE
ncbi:MAG: tetratricopeptide repeat protein [Thiotrichales bacterium]